jgi:hypothetical protein
MSARQAEFLHHEVPGIIVPDDVRAETASVDESAAHVQGVPSVEKTIAGCGSNIPWRLFDYAVSTRQDDE